ncbi:hypothetical protein LXA43DRAFT_1101509 [Ganoderma leucocontextum]|nr:hypothetical protein LXA43DRAFT_1101509 [Ganoderma leucocontextum]
MNLRQDLPVPTQQEIFYRRTKDLLIWHPGLDVPLLRLAALSTGSTATPYGVFRSLVLNACRVLTNHAAHYDADFLATDIEGQNRVPIDDTPLDFDCYYFLGPPEVAAHKNYPIVKTFSAFTFPRTLPPDWAGVANATRDSEVQTPQRQPQDAPSRFMAAAVQWRDVQCAATRYPDAAQCAYLIPKAEAAWFHVNRMGLYARDDLSMGVNCPSNGILLRADVYKCLDSYNFIFYPSGDGTFVAYFVRKLCAYLPELLHRRVMTIHSDVPAEFLYARFALAIINLPRPDNIRLDAVPESEAIKRWKVKMLEEEQEKQASKRTTSTAEGDQRTSDTSSERGGDNDIGDDLHVSGSDEEPEMQSSSTTSNKSRTQSPLEEDDAEDDRRWKELLFARLPELANLPEVEHPPETFTGSHVETPHMLRLRSEYIKQNPQVWRTSTTSADATREDMDGFYADFLTRPT